MLLFDHIGVKLLEPGRSKAEVSPNRKRLGIEFVDHHEIWASYGVRLSAFVCMADDSFTAALVVLLKRLVPYIQSLCEGIDNRVKIVLICPGILAILLDFLSASFLFHPPKSFLAKFPSCV